MKLNMCGGCKEKKKTQHGGRGTIYGEGGCDG
jgi:hypothetical protein